MPTLGKFIQRKRFELGYSQEQLAEKIGPSVRQAEISRLENDKILLPRRERLEQIAIALDVSLGELLARSGWSGAEDEFVRANAIDDLTPIQPVGTTVDGDRMGTLSEAITRAEELIAISDQVLERSKVTFNQARRAVQHAGTGRVDRTHLSSK